MAIIPSNTQFRGDTTGVPIVEKGSSQTQGRAGIFTMQDIIDTTGGVSGTAGKVAKFATPTSLGDGLLNDDGGVRLRRRLSESWEISSTLGTESGVDLYYILDFD